MAKFNFNLRRPKGNMETPINLIIRWSGLRLMYSTHEAIDPKLWETDPKKRNFQRAKETRQFPEHSELNARLNDIESRAKTVFRRFLNDQKRLPSENELKNLLDREFRGYAPGKEKSKSKEFFEFIEQFIAEAAKRNNSDTGKFLSPSTLGIYRNTRDLLKEFQVYRKQKIDFGSITLELYYEFKEYLANVRGFANNTIGKHIKTLKTFLNDATERGINTNIAYKSKRFKTLAEETSSIYLSKEELEELSMLDLSACPRLDKVRDLFLVGCWTGLRFSDFSRIRPENINGDFIEIKTKKTGESVVIPIHRAVKQIMKKYKAAYENSLPPAISNVKMNYYLKELGQMVERLHTEIETSITKAGKVVSQRRKKYELMMTHTARRSFATNLYKENLSSITIMKITGHRTEKAFLRYIKVTPQENAKLLQQHWLRTENEN